METLAVKYRPTEFEDVSGQSFTVAILKNQIETKQIKNGYLFCGASGCGKTTCARIFADKINNGKGKPIELDAASNNGVENIRELVKEAVLKSLNSEYKVYIIDEAHSITSQGWQAFLKTLEEPPRNTIFIFCTTDPQKIPLTIQNRLQRFDFLRMDVDTIKKRLIYILEKEDLIDKVEIDSIEYISKTAHGGMRDAITNLDKCLSLSSDVLTIKDVIRILQFSDYDTLIELILNINDINKILSIINEVYESGQDLRIFINQLINFILDLLKAKLIGIEVTDIPIIYKEQLNDVIENGFETNRDLLPKLMDLKYKITYETYNKPLVEGFFIGGIK